MYLLVGDVNQLKSNLFQKASPRREPNQIKLQVEFSQPVSYGKVSQSFRTSCYCKVQNQVTKQAGKNDRYAKGSHAPKQVFIS